MSTYLIMRCDLLNDQYECDANRTPVAITDNWRNWYENNHPAFDFEVWEYKNGCFTLKNGYEDYIDKGMSFIEFWFDERESLQTHEIKYFPNLTRNDEIPKTIKESLLLDTNNITMKKTKQKLAGFGTVRWKVKNKTYAYCESFNRQPYGPF